MAVKSYIVTQDFKTPYVVNTGQPHRPTEIKAKCFKRGQIINGEMKHANNQPAFVLVKGTLVVPLSVVKEVIAKDINSGADGVNVSNMNTSASKTIVVDKNPKMKYFDAAIIGALLGVGAVYLAQKKAWIKIPDKKNFLYGAGIGALAGFYIMYRQKNKVKVKSNE